MNDSASKPMSPWIVTTDPKSLRRLGKTIEEMGELIAVLGRVIIQGIDEVDPSSGDTNRLRLRKEMADVLAQVELTGNWFGISGELVGDRMTEKLRQMAEWESHFTNQQS